jgi:hypothetical protein
VLAVLVHELADFGLEFPGVAFPTAVTLGVVVGRVEEKAAKHHEERPVLPGLAGVAGLAVWFFALIGGAWAAPHTLDNDWSRCAAAVKQRSPEVERLVATAIARHPADDHLELLAAEVASDGSSLKHLNRALLLHPANAQAHHLAARWLARFNYKAQAALEYRVASELGRTISYNEVYSVVGPRILDAAPRTPEAQLVLAQYLAQTKRPELALQAARRGVELGDHSERSLAGALSVATQIGDPKAIAGAARLLVASDPTPAGYLAASRGFLSASSPSEADDAIARGMKSHPADSTLVLAGARQRYDRGELMGARAMLRRMANGGFSLADRKAAEELAALIADKAGDVDGAVLARARAKLIAHKLEASGQ